MFNKTRLPTKEAALPGRSEAMPVPETHFVNGAPIKGPFPAGLEQAVFGLGCFWGAERKFWQLPGVYTHRRRLRAPDTRRIRPTVKSAAA